MVHARKVCLHILCISCELRRRKKHFPYNINFIFPVGAVSCQRTDGFLSCYFRSASLPALIGCQGRLHITWCVIAWSGLCSTSHIFQMPSTSACFPMLSFSCDFPHSRRMSSWCRSCWISLQSGPCPSLSRCGQYLLLHKGVQETLHWLVTGFCSLR